MNPEATSDATAAQPAVPETPRLTRAERNRRNAQRSTGPRTPEGKAVSRLNAVQHGGTGQIVLLPGEDAAAYQQFAAAQMAALKPANEDEAAFAQSIVDHRWQLARVQTYENNLLFLLPSTPGPAVCGDEGEGQSQLDHAASAARTFFDNLQKFDLMGRYAARLNRLILQNHNKLTDLQSARRAAEREARSNALRFGPIDIERDMPDLPEPIRRRMQQMRDAAKQAVGGPPRAQQNQHSSAVSGFVSQTPSSQPARGAQNTGAQAKSPSKRLSGSSMKPAA